MSSAIEWLQNSNRKLRERLEREQARSKTTCVCLCVFKSLRTKRASLAG
jgi:hypothetical protein